jgi:tetratricopeptide (TPR) repeat protein
MKGARVDRVVGCVTSVADRLIVRTVPSRDPTDLIFARQALDRWDFADAEPYLRRALDADPESAEVQTLMGILHERLGEHHAAYHCYKRALKADRHNWIALAGMRRYCERFGLDFHRRSINPTRDEHGDD